MPSPLIAQWTLSDDVLHLNHGSFGAAPRAVQAEQQRHRDLLEANPDAFVHSHYQPALDYARERVAEFVGADANSLGFVNNATAGVNAIIRSLESTLGPGDEIVITNHTYNACRNAALVAAERSGGTLVTADIPFPLGIAHEIVDAVLGAVTDRTKLVVLDAVTSPTALVFPIAELTAALEPDVPVLVDAAHAPGMIPYDLDELGASYTTANCHKWMCAPKGAAFLHVRADRQEGIYPSVIGHGYNSGWPSAGRHMHRQFDWIGTDDPSAWFSVPVAIDTVAALHADGWDGVREHNRSLCLAARHMICETLGIEPPTPDELIGSIASIPVPPPQTQSGSIFDELMIALRERWQIEVPVFVWPEAPDRLLRISAHLYNSLDDYERLCEALTAEL